MDTNDLPAKLLDTITQHLPTGSDWMPLAGVIVMGVVGLVFMVKGAKLAPVLAAIAFAGLGAVTGLILSHSLPVPPWPLIVVTGTVGLLLGIVLFRLWFALLVAGCLVAAALSLYGGNVLQPALNDYPVRGLQPSDTGVEVTLLEPGTALVTIPPWNEELANLWSYLGQTVPTFQTSFYTIVIMSGLAGLVFALLLPKAARAFWAATVGTGLFLPAVYALMHSHWPSGASWLAQHGLFVAAVIWSISLIYNLADVLNWSPKKPAPEPKPEAA